MRALETTNTTPANVLIIDHHALVRSGLKSLVQQAGCATNISQAANASSALDYVYADTQYDLILMDINNLSDMDGIKLLQTISAHTAPQGTAIIVISSTTDQTTVQQVKSAGAHRFLPKDASGIDIIRSIQSVLRHKITPKDEADQVTGASHAKKKLSKRQLQILQYLSQGMSNKEISQTIFLSEGTIKNHITQIFGFFGVSNRTQAIIEAEKRNLVKNKG